MVGVVTRRVPMTRDAALRSRVKGNFYARFWNSGGRGDSPADCSGMWKNRLGACRRENVVANHKAFRLVFSRPCARKNLLVPQSSLVREALLVVGHLSGCLY